MQEIRLDSNESRRLWRAERIINAVRLSARGRRSPIWRGWGEPFNGQYQRMRAIQQLVDRFQPDAFVETGTHFGFTTRHLASYGVPVFTVELDPGIRLFAKRRLRDRPNVTLIHGNSNVALEWLASGAAIHRPLLYLDAHAPGELPLAAELETILARWQDFALVIDDFKVDTDPGYEYWSFQGTPLALETLKLPDDVVAAFPGPPASSETGSRRGAVYVGRGDGAVAISELAAIGLLTLSD